MINTDLLLSSQPLLSADDPYSRSLPLTARSLEVPQSWLWYWHWTGRLAGVNANGILYLNPLDVEKLLNFEWLVDEAIAGTGEEFCDARD